MGPIHFNLLIRYKNINKVLFNVKQDVHQKS